MGEPCATEGGIVGWSATIVGVSWVVEWHAMERGTVGWGMAHLGTNRRGVLAVDQLRKKIM